MTATRPDPQATVPVVVIAWFLGVTAATLVLGVLHGDTDVDPPTGVLAASLGVLWAVHLGATVVASRRAGTGDPIADFGIRIRLVDLVGVPIGVASQLVLVPAVYAPLQRVWPDTFDSDRLEQTARDLVERASGSATVLLWLLIVIGAPFVEEVFYRGLLQRPLLSRFPAPAVIVAVAAVFAAIHFRPVEFVGLFAFGIVLGVCAWRADRLGPAIVAHVAFNATGLALVS